MVIDCHTHINNYHNEEVDSIQECLNNLITSMKRNRVDKSMILTSYRVGPGRPSTKEAVDATRDLDNVFIVAGMDYHRFSAAEIKELEGYAKEGSIKGLKLYPGYQPFYPNDEKWEALYALAAEYKLPVMIHSGDTYTPKGKVKYSHPIHVDEAAVDHPDVNFVICHLGNPWTRDCMEVVYKNKNVYTDISGLVLGNFSDRFERYMRKQLEEMLLFGVEPDKVLFGTDWPISSMETYLEFMEELAAPVKEKQKILYQNAERLFNL